MRKDDPETPEAYAARLFAEGHFCAEAVLLAGAKHLGVASETMPAIATGFCSGLARTSGLCGASHVCVDAICYNSVKDGRETDIDCGGLCTRCAIGKHCVANTDCASLRCSGGFCTYPLGCTDRSKSCCLRSCSQCLRMARPLPAPVPQPW